MLNGVGVDFTLYLDNQVVAAGGICLGGAEVEIGCILIHVACAVGSFLAESTLGTVVHKDGGAIVHPLVGERTHQIVGAACLRNNLSASSEGNHYGFLLSRFAVLAHLGNDEVLGRTIDVDEGLAGLGTVDGVEGDVVLLILGIGAGYGVHRAFLGAQANGVALCINLAGDNVAAEAVGHVAGDIIGRFDDERRVAAQRVALPGHQSMTGLLGMQVGAALTGERHTADEDIAITKGGNLEGGGVERQAYIGVVGTGAVDVQATTAVLDHVGRVAHLDEAEQRSVLIQFVGKEEVVTLAHVSSGNQLEYGFFRVLLIQQAHVHILAEQVAQCALVGSRTLIPVVFLVCLFSSEAQAVPLAGLHFVGTGNHVGRGSLQSGNQFLRVCRSIHSGLVVSLGFGNLGLQCVSRTFSPCTGSGADNNNRNLLIGSSNGRTQVGGIHIDGHEGVVGGLQRSIVVERDVILILRNSSNGSLQVGGDFAHHLQLTGGVLGDGGRIELELGHVAIATACSGGIQIEADILVALGGEAVRSQGLGVAGERCVNFSQELAGILLGLGIVGAIDTPLGDMVVGHGTTGEGEGGTGHLFGSGEFHLQVVQATGHIAIFPPAVPIGGGIAVDEQAIAVVGRIALLVLILLLISGGVGAGELCFRRNQGLLGVHLRDDILGYHQGILAFRYHGSHFLQHGIAVADGGIFLNQGLCLGIIHLHQTPLAGTGSSLPAYHIGTASCTASMTILVEILVVTALRSTAEHHHKALLGIGAHIGDGHLVALGLQCGVQFHGCALCHVCHTAVVATVHHVIVARLGVISEMEQEGGVLVLLQALPPHRVFTHVCSLHGGGHLLVVSGLVILVQHRIALFVKNRGADGAGVGHGRGEEIVAVGKSRHLYLAVEHSLIEGFYLSCQFLGGLDVYLCLYRALHDALYPLHLFLEQGIGCTVGILAHLVTEVEEGFFLGLGQTAVILQQQLVEQVGSIGSLLGLIQLELGAVPEDAVGGGTVDGCEAQIGHRRADGERVRQGRRTGTVEGEVDRVQLHPGSGIGAAFYQE